MNTDPDRVKHLEMVETVVARLASNSFLLKGWCVTLVAGIFALGSKEANRAMVILAIVPVVLFWGLDAYYLAEERRFRSLYDAVLSISATNVPAANGAIVPLFSMDPSRVCKPRDTWFNAAVSVTLVSFYMTLMLCVFAAGWLIHSQPGRAA